MHTKKRVVVGGIGLVNAVVAVVMVSLVSSSTSSLAQGGSAARPAPGGASLPLSSTRWNTFVADVTVRATHVTSDGEPIGAPAEPMRYRWERSQSGAGWKTVMTIAERSITVGSGKSRQTVANPFAVARIEDDEDGSPLRLYGRDGERIHPPSVADLQQWTESSLRRLDPDAAERLRKQQQQQPRVANHEPSLPAPSRRFVGSAERDWIGGFVAMPDQRTARRTRLAQQLMRTGQVRGFDRFTKSDGPDVHEVLVDPQSAVPVEVNMLRDGQLMSHSTITYQPDASGALVRRAVHVERQLSPAGERGVTDTEYTNVHVEDRRPQ